MKSDISVSTSVLKETINKKNFQLRMSVATICDSLWEKGALHLKIEFEI